MNLIDLVFPKRCVSCKKLGKYFCHSCLTKIEHIQYQICPVCSRNAIYGITHPRCRTLYSLDGLVSFFRYKGVIQKAVKAIKYRLVFDLSKELVQAILKEDLSLIINHTAINTILVPVPLHESRLRERGFNQTEVLGNLLAKRLGINIDTQIIRRLKKTTPQTEVKDRKERLKNMHGVFGIKKLPSDLRNLKVILFDDVYTTGATLRSAGNTLKRAGIKYVFGMTLAHG